MKRAAIAFALCFIACVPKPAPDVCEGVDCGEGRCAVLDGAPTCVNVDVVDRCASKPCEGLTNSLCITDGAQTRCECPASRIEIAGACVLRTPCLPNPCTNANQTTCDDSTGVALCQCDGDTVFDGTRCVRPLHWDCSRVHAGDSAEPDECPRLAFNLARDVTVNRTLSPAGDHDWFRINVTPGFIAGFEASGNVPLIIEVFDELGARVAADTRALPSANVNFLVPNNVTELFVRVRAVLATDEDTYVARFRDLGHDDFVNEPANAQLHSGSFTGTLQYEGDVDVVKLQLLPQVATEFSSDSGIATFTLEFADGGTRVIDGQRVSFTPRIEEQLTVTARGRTARSEGRFTLDVTSRGPDDHSDDARYATFIPLATEVSGAIQFTGDVDTFLFRPLLHHVYRATVIGDVTLAMFANSSTQVVVGNEWKASDTTAVQLRIRGNEVAYTVRIDDLGFDEHGDSALKATNLAVATAISGTLEYGNDVDFFRINVPAGRVLHANVTSPGGTATVTLYDRVGASFGSSNATLAFCVPAFDSYYLGVKSTAATSYTLEVRDRGPDDFGDANSPSVLPAESTVNGSLQWSADVDAFQLSLTPGRIYRANCVSSGPCHLLVTGPGLTVTGIGSVNFIAPTTGPFLLQLSLPVGTPVPVSWSLKVTDIGSDDHGDLPAAATPLIIDTANTGKLEWQGDVDTFAVPVVANRLYEADVIGAQVDVFQLVHNSVQLLMPNNAFRATLTETLYVDVSALEGQLGGNYTLLVRDVGLDDHGDTLQTSSSLQMPAISTARIQFVGDNDFIDFPVTPGRYYLSTASECVQLVRSMQQGVVSERAYGEVIFRAPANETRLWIRFSGLPTAPCPVNIRESVFDDHANEAIGATPLSFDAGIDGVWEMTSDIDAFSFDLVAGTTPVGVHLHQNGNTILNSLTLIKPTGEAVTGLGGIGFQVTDTGRYSVLTFGRTPGQHYTVSLSTEADDFGNTFAQATPMTVGVTQHGARQYTNDIDSFSITLQAGVAYSVRTAPEAQALARILNANGQAVSGPVPVTGTYEVRINWTDTRIWVPHDYAVRVDALD